MSAASPAQGATAVQASAQKQSAEVTCTNCGTTEPWGLASWCPSCGFYPSLGGSADVVAQAETKLSRQYPTDEVVFDHWWEIIPPWGWVLIGGCFFIFVESIVLHFAMTVEQGRGLIALGQLAVGALALFVVQLQSFLFATRRTDKLGPMDMFTKPIETWNPTLDNLPDTQVRVWVGAWSLSAMICAVAVMGGIPYNALFDDWGFEEREEVNLVKEIATKARYMGSNGAGSLEEAMEDFAGTQEEIIYNGEQLDEAALKEAMGVDPDAEEEPTVLNGNGVNKGDKDKKEGEDEEKKDEEEEVLDPAVYTDTSEWPTQDCLILGYNVTGYEDISALHLAAVVDGEFKYIGYMPMERVSVITRKQILFQMERLRRPTPLIPTEREATWINPSMMCQVAYLKWGKDGLLVMPKFRKLLPKVQLK